MGNKKISEFPTVDEIRPNDHLLLSSDDETYKIPAGMYTDSMKMQISEEFEGRVSSLEEDMKTKGIEVDDLGLYQDPESGFVYPTYRGEVSSNGIPLASFGSGGGGSSNNAILTVANTSGWLAKTISKGAECKISINWSSLDGDIPTGNGTAAIRVNGILKRTTDVAQGMVELDVSQYLSDGVNKVKLTISDSYDNARTIAFTITTVELSLSSAFDSGIAYEAGAAIKFTYTPTGAIKKNVVFIVDGNPVGEDVVSTSNRQVSFLLPAMSHGSHTLLVFFTAEINGEEVKSNELFYDLIVAQEGFGTPIISSPFRVANAIQHTAFTIPYYVYNPSSMSSSVSLYADGKLITSLTVDRTEQLWTFVPEMVGELTLEIVSGPTTKTFSITVSESNIHIEAESDSLSLFLSSTGRHNAENNPEKWEYKNVSATLSDFNFRSDGWLNDNDNNTVLRVSGDARVVIPAMPFDKDFRTTGKTIEIEFSTSSVMDYDAIVLSCMSGGRGIELTAQKAILRSQQSEIFTQYKENEHVRVSFVVEKKSENRLIFIYLNGIMSGAIQYPDDDDFSQRVPALITIGSNECTVDIYSIRIYDNDLTRHQILSNWIADSQNAGDRISRYSRNDIFNEYGSVSLNKMGDRAYMILRGDSLPQYKGNKKTISGEFFDPLHPDKCFNFSDAEIDVQGTSSQYYPRKNYKIKFKKGFIVTTGETFAKYKIRENSVPTNTFTFKADVASSEGANNVELARLYNDICPYQTPAQEENSSIRQGIDGFPIVMFWDDGEEISFIGKYNFNNDKGTPEVFGFSEGDESWEVLNNTSDRVIFKSHDFNGDAWKNDFESRYPSDYFNKSQLEEFATWVNSTDTAAAKGHVLDAPVSYNGVTYTHDTTEYRLAKFKAELADYVEIESVLFYYLFTELFLMVDSRAKNMFPSFIGGYI